jgi:hypothetical protein
MVIQGFARANLDASGIGAVHAGPTGEEPVQLSLSFHLPELHLEPSFRAEVGRVLIAASVL